MFKTNGIRFLCFVVIYLVSAIGLQAQSEVGTETEKPAYATGYKDEGFKGESEKFLVGKYGVMEKGWKDEIKSIALNGAVRVTLFAEEQFEGKKLVIETSMPKLEDLAGEAESMIVEPFTCSYVTAFKNTLFEGDSKEFQTGEYSELTNGWDDMESIDLCGGVNVTLYKKKGFQGESVTITKDRIDLGEFRNKVESMKVTADTN